MTAASVKKIFLNYFPKKKNEIGFWLIDIGVVVFISGFIIGMLVGRELPHIVIYTLICGGIIIISGIILDNIFP